MRPGPVRATRETAARGAVALGLALTALVCVIRPLSVVVPGSGLDESWIAVLGEAATHPVRWGVDLAFSYGPASTLLTRYFTDGYLALNLPFAVATALVWGACSTLLIRRVPSDRAAVILAFGALQALALVSQASQDMDAFVFALAFNITLLDIVRPDRGVTPRCVLIGGAALLGVLALAKTSLGLFGLMLLVLADCRSLGARRAPWLTLAFVLAALVTGLACGQRLDDLPTFVATQWSFAAGYGDAMWIDANHIELLAYLAASLALIGVAATSPGPRNQHRWVALGVAGALLLGLKAGFVRSDSHTQIAWSLLGFCGLSVAAALVLPRSVRTAGAVGIGCVALLWVWAPLVLILDTHRPKRGSELTAVYAGMVDVVVAEATAWTYWLQDPSAFAAGARADKAAAWDDVRDQNPLPRLEGTVDILVSRQSSVLANRLDFRPRPSFQEYATYDRRLIAANAAFYAGASRPDWVLFGLHPIDGRYPAFTEGALWPALLSRYEPVGQAGPLLALRARPGSPPDGLGLRQETRLRMGSPLTPPAGTVFARLRVHKTMLGRLASLLFRLPGLHLDIVAADGSAGTFRLIPAIAEAGFLLSPTVSDPAQFAALARGELLTAKRVVSMSVGSSPSGSLFYEPDIDVAFQPMTLQPTPTSAEARALARQLNLEEPAPNP